MKDLQYIQEEFVGKTFTEKLNDKMAAYFQERKFQKLGYIPRPGVIAMVHTLKDGEIKSLGASDPDDIINNNFGKWLAAMMTPVSGALGSTSLAELGGPGGVDPPVDITGSTAERIWWTTDAGQVYQRRGHGITLFQIGSGVTAPDVADVNIETAFPSSPESLRTLIIGTGGYNGTTGRVSLGTNIGPTTDAGTVNELALYMTWARFPPNTGANTYLLSHDEISPGVAFITGETLFCQYFWQL